jgi:hypothetical protein
MVEDAIAQQVIDRPDRDLAAREVNLALEDAARPVSSFSRIDSAFCKLPSIGLSVRVCWNSVPRIAGSPFARRQSPGSW